ncbi:hypothetical protein CK247_30830, partial [Klebsiella pneumoniae]
MSIAPTVSLSVLPTTITCCTSAIRRWIPPYTPGALRGGSHVHVYSPNGQFVSFTYNDHVL